MQKSRTFMRAMSSMEFSTRSPFENVVQFLGGLPQGHEKALKHALYNALALLLLFVCSAAGWALYIILDPFITPLLWAAMCGSVLHPFKHSVATMFSNWIKAVESTNSPILLVLCMTPINIIHEVSEFIGSILVKHAKILLLVIVGILFLHVIYSYTPHICICIFWRFGKLIISTLTWFINCCSTSLVATVLVAYVGLLAVFWEPARAKQFEVASWPVWIIFSSYIANQLGTFEVHIFFLIQFVVFVGFLLEVWKFHEEKNEEGAQLSFYSSFKKMLQLEPVDDCEGDKSQDSMSKIINEEDAEVEEKVDILTRNVGIIDSKVETLPTQVDDNTSLTKAKTVVFESLPEQYSTSGSTVTMERQLFRLLRKQNQETETDHYHRLFGSTSTNASTERSTDGDKYIYGVLWACLGMLIFNHSWILSIVPIPIFIYFVNHIGQYFGIWELIGIQWKNLELALMNWYIPRQFGIIPVPVMCLTKIIMIIHIKLLQILKNTSDAVASVVVIFGVIIFFIATTTFIGVQVYAEGIHMVQVSASVINSTVVSNSEFFNQIIPAEWYENMDSMLGNAYTQGREGISTVVRGWLADVDKVKAAHLEKQVLDLWDRIYQSWMSSNVDQNFVGPTVPPSAIWENLVDGVQKTPDLFSYDIILDFGRANMDSLMSVLQTVWTISKGNISLVLHSVTALLSIVFGGGTAVLNLLLNTVVFFTALFYLLSTSGVLYKPVEMITNFSPTYGNRFAVALEEAFTGVFKASFKMAMFYGCWTWLIHNIFKMKIVYLPSVLASLLAAVPFLGTYWACVPAVLDLWLAQDKGLQAIILFVFQFLPTNVVDTTIYKEIQGGGHPYLTGLSIAGGIFCMGVQGAIIGPLLLCGLFVAIKMSGKLMMDSPTNVKLTQQISQLTQQIQGAHSTGGLSIFSGTKSRPETKGILSTPRM